MKPKCYNLLSRFLIISVLILILTCCFSTVEIKAQGVKGQISVIDPSIIAGSTPCPTLS